MSSDIMDDGSNCLKSVRLPYSTIALTKQNIALDETLIFLYWYDIIMYVEIVMVKQILLYLIYIAGVAQW